MKRLFSALLVPLFFWFAWLQLNDHDWYIWFTVYAFTAGLLLINAIHHTLIVSRTMLYTAALLQIWGVLLLAWSINRLLQAEGGISFDLFYYDEEFREAWGLLICVTALYFTRFGYGKNYPADRDPQQQDFTDSDLTSPDD